MTTDTIEKCRQVGLMTRLKMLGFVNVHARVQRQIACISGRHVSWRCDRKGLEAGRLRVRYARLVMRLEEEGREEDGLSAGRKGEQTVNSDNHQNSDDFVMSTEALALLREQLRHPVFDPSLVHGELGSILSRLQDGESVRFVRWSDLSAVEGEDRTNVGKAVDILAEGYERYIEYARETIKQTFAGITEPGGKLYPQMRSDACWRDLVSFTRVVGYAIASDGLGFSERGLDTLSRVYKQLDVPLNAVLVGVDAVRRAAVQDARNAQNLSVDVLDNQHQQNTTIGTQSQTTNENPNVVATLLHQMFTLLLSHLKRFQHRPSQ